MNYNQRNKSVMLIVLIFVGFFFLFPFLFISFVDGFSVLFVIPFFMILFFGIFIVAAIKFNNSQNYRRTTVFTEDTTCTQCGNGIESNHKYCPHCGMKQLEYIVCEYCGHHNNKQNLQCEECNALIKWKKWT